jgi:hypothetical protein
MRARAAVAYLLLSTTAAALVLKLSFEARILLTRIERAKYTSLLLFCVGTTHSTSHEGKQNNFMLMKSNYYARAIIVQST